ncbi:MAG: MarR family transcriptional regulator [Pseudomonadota bacterium]
MSMTERVALDLLKTAFTSSVAGDTPDLTARQTAILMVVALERGPHTVRGLAARLDVSKPVVTRAVDRLESLALVRRLSDERDLRSVFIERTEAGTLFLRGLARPIVKAASHAKSGKPIAEAA